MTKKHIAVIVATLACTSTMAQGFSGGVGTKDNPYLISTVEDLNSLNELTNKSATSGKYFRLTQDITEPFTGIIGTEIVFKGNFDGGGHCITVNIDRPTEEYVGLFGTVISGSVHDLAVDGYVNGYYSVAGIVSNPSNGAVLYNLANYADVTSTNTSVWASVGGVAGNIASLKQIGSEGATMKNCANYGKITCSGGVMGGVIGYSGQSVGNTIEDIANYGRIEATSTNRVAGIIGNPMYYDKVHRVANFGTLSLSDMSGALGNTNPEDMGEIFYDKQYACTSVVIPSQQKSTSEMLGEQMKASLGDGWTYSDDMLPRPSMGGLENDPRAILYATPIILAEGDSLTGVSKNFRVVTANGIAWTAKNGNVVINSDGSVALAKKGEETLIATYQGHSRNLVINVTAVTTGIDEIEAETEDDGAWYTLAGLKVMKPTKGIFIHNGKKVMVK